jgi:hypothetical protein
MGRVLGRSMCNSFKEQKEAEIGEREREITLHTWRQ